MGKFSQTLQVKIKSSSSGMLIFLLRFITGGLLGLTFALIGEEIFGFGSFSFTFIVVSILAAFLRISRGWGIVYLLVFNLICILVGLLLRMYILIAPGA